MAPLRERAVDAGVTGAREVLRVALRSWLRLDVAGLHHVPREGGLLVAATHESHADSLALGAAFGRRLDFLGSADLADTPVIGGLLPRFGMLPVERGAGDVGLLDTLAELVGEGRALVVYPEGSRSRDGGVHRPRSGVARLALATGVPVLPVGLSGTGAAWPVDDRPRLLHGTRVRVRVGAPMLPPGGSPRDRRAWSDELHDRLVSLSGRERVDQLAPVGGAA